MAFTFKFGGSSSAGATASGSGSTSGGAGGFGGFGGGAPRAGTSVAPPTTAAAGSGQMFMFVAVAQHTPEKSFEEVRIDDYLLSYRSTGRPPQPCPQEPKDENARRSMGLPPLFQPHSESALPPRPLLDAQPQTQARGLAPAPTLQDVLAPSPVSASSSLGPSPAVAVLGTGPAAVAARVSTNPNDLPDAQEYLADDPFARGADGDTLQTIVATRAYIGFSPEELRYHAYFKGHRTAPKPIRMSPFVQGPPTTSTGSTLTRASPSRGAIMTSSSLMTGTQETFLNICTKPEFAGHSPEELRVAFMRYGRELTSQEIVNTASQPPVLRAAAAAAAPVNPFSRPTAVKPF